MPLTSSAMMRASASMPAKRRLVVLATRGAVAALTKVSGIAARRPDSRRSRRAVRVVGVLASVNAAISPLRFAPVEMTGWGCFAFVEMTEVVDGVDESHARDMSAAQPRATMPG